MVTKTRRFVMDTAHLGNQSMEGRVELDTHADTCVAGSNTVVLDLTGKLVSVSPFCEDEFDSIQDVPIATVATAYDCHETGKTYVLVINEALYLGDKMAHTLICPNQLRFNGLRVDDCPKQFDVRSTHSIHIPEADLSIPLTMRGIISGFHTRIPTLDELEDLSLHVELTSDQDWNPYAEEFSEQETVITMRSETRLTSTIVTAVSPSVLRQNVQSIVELDSAERNDMADRLIGMLCHHVGRPLCDGKEKFYSRR